MTVSKEIIDMARQAKLFIRETGEDALADSLLVRAAVTFNMLVRRYGGKDDPGALMLLNDSRFGLGMEMHTRAHAIAVIASNFADEAPSTPERAELFSTALDISNPASFTAVV